MGFLLLANAQTSVLHESFDGTIGGDNGASWFDANKWKDSGSLVPTKDDMVWIDEPNTYLAIDETSEAARVAELIIGRTSSSDALNSVHLDMLEGTKLEVGKDMAIGALEGSDGTVYAQDGAEIEIEGQLSVGSDEGGNGILVLQGSARLTAKKLAIGNNDEGGSRIVMDDKSVLRIRGNKVAAVGKMISNGLIVALSANKAGATKKIFDVRKVSGKTVVKVVDDDPSADPDDCQDRALRYKKRRRKNCSWVGKKRNKRCKLEWKSETLGDWCPVTCNVCTPDNNDNNNNNDACEDQTDLKFLNNASKNCEWVAEKTTGKRCKKAWKGTTLATFCPKTCGAC